MQEVLRNMLGSFKLKEGHRDILQALQGPNGTSLPELLATVTQMCLMMDKEMRPRR